MDRVISYFFNLFIVSILNLTKIKDTFTTSIIQNTQYLIQRNLAAPNYTFVVKQAVTAFSVVTTSTSSTIVAATTTLSVTATLPSGNTFATGDVIYFTLPTSTYTAYFVTSGGNTVTSSTTGITVTASTVTTYTASITISATVTSTKISFKITNFKNQPSTNQITGLTLTLTSSGGTQKAYSSGLSITGTFYADQLTSGSLTPVSDLIGNTASSITITLTPKNNFPSNGFVVVYFPYWNPSSSSPSHQISSSTPTCTAGTNANSGLNCTYNTDTQKLIVKNLVSADTSGSAITFTCDSFLNPYSGVPRTGYTITTTDSGSYSIDTTSGYTTLSVTVSTWASFTRAIVGRVDGITTVEESSVLNAVFEVDFPVDANCRLIVYFPSDMPVTTAMTNANGVGIFYTNGNAAASVDTTNNYMQADGCLYYSEDYSADVSLDSGVNIGWVKQTQSFQYFFYAMSSGTAYNIAKVTTGLEITTDMLSVGDITSFAVTAYDSQVVQASTRYTLSIQPTHSIPTNSKIVIGFPSLITLTSGSCAISAASGVASTSATSCSVSSNTLTISNPFGSGSFTKGGSAFTITASAYGTNPTCTEDAGTFTVKSYATISSVDYQIDDDSFSSVFTPTPSTLTAASLTPGTFQTYDSPVTYTLSITPGKTIPKNGILVITYPSEVGLSGSTVSSCTYTISGSSTTSTSISTTATSPVTLKITDAFSSSAYTSTGTAFLIACDSFRNPRTTAVTSTATIQTYDSALCGIESKTTGITTQMTIIGTISTFTVTPSSVINGDTNNYLVSVVSTIPHIDTDYITITFPSEVTLPSSISCSASTSVSSVSCSKSGSTVTATFTFSSGQVAKNTAFSFYVQNVQNPPSTQPSSAFSSIALYDATNVKLSSYSGSSVIITDTTPATVTTKSLTQLSKAIAASTDYTITYSTINAMASGGAFYITYPSDVSVSSLSTCSVTYSTVTYSMSSCSVNTGSRVIKVGGGFNTAVTAGGSIDILLSPITNPVTSATTPGTFTLISYTDTTYTYTIDQITSGLVPQFDCTYPCKTCNNPTSTTTCYSCFTSADGETQYLYLYNYQCLTACPTGYYSDSSNVCQPCDSACKTCTSATVCTSCYTTSTLPYLYSGWCYSVCPSGFCPISFVCSACIAPSMTSLTITPSPTTVNTASTLTFTAVLDSTTTDYFLTNDVLTFIVPSPGSFTAASSTSLCSPVTSGVTVTSCDIYANQVTMTLSVTSSSLQTFSVNVGNFLNPPSTSTISPVYAYLIDSSGSAVEYYTTGSLSGFTPAVLASASITPNNLVVGASGVTITVSLTLTNALSTNGQISVLFPYWNPSSSSPSHMIASTTPTCTGTVNMATALTCSYSTSTKTLTLSGTILTTAASASTNLQFTVDNFQNPYNAYPKSSFYVTTYDSSGYSIDKSSALSVTVTTFTTFSASSVTRSGSVTTVQELSALQTDFTLGLPIDASCRWRIYFPSDMPVTSAMTSVSGSNLFASPTLTTVSTGSNYIDITGCSSYQDSGQSATAILSQLLNINYVTSTSTFQFELYAVVSGSLYNIAQVTSGLTFASSMFTTGSFLSFSVSAYDTSVVYASTRYQITVKPYHYIPATNNLVITFPSSITLTDQASGVCALTLTSGVISSSATCTVSSNVITITNAFGSSTFLKGGSQFSFLLSSYGTNPTTTASAGSFLVGSYATVSGTDYGIDYSTFTNVYYATPATLTASVSSVSSYLTSDTPVTYTFSLTPNIQIPSSGIIEITFPSTITLDSSYSSPTCTITKGGSTSSLTVTNTATSPLAIKLTNGFSSAYTSTGTAFTIACTGLQNPRTTATTSSFSIKTEDASGYSIETVSTGVTVTMLTTPTFTVFTATQSSYINGDKNIYQFKVTPTIKLYSTDVLYFTFPSETTMPTSPSCTVVSSISSISCSYVSTNRIKASLTFSSGSLSSGTAFKFNVSNVANPPSTKTSSTFSSISFTDSSAAQILSYSGSSVTVTDTTPANITIFSFTQSNTNMSETATYNLTFYTINAMSSGSAFIITYPSIVSMPSSKTFTTCFVMHLNIKYYFTSCTINTSTRKISLSGGFTAAVSAGAALIISIGPITNPETSLTLSTFTMTSYSDSTFTYTHDQILTGLFPYYQCTYPCKTCPAISSSTCNSCYTTVKDIKLRYLYNQTCITTCPTGYTSVNYQCKPCTSPCKTCLVSQTQCQSCISNYFLYGTQCLSSCPTGSVSSGTSCVACDKNCQECSASTKKCSKCSTGYYLINDQCFNACPDGYSPDSTNTTCVSNDQEPPAQTGNLIQYDSTDNNTYVYFPTTITQTILGGVVAGSFIMDKGSLWMTNALGLWGPLEMISMGGQLYLSYNQMSGQNSQSTTTATTSSRILNTEAFQTAQNGILPIVFYGTVFAVLSKIITNILSSLLFIMIIKKDPGFVEYRKKHWCMPTILQILGTLFSFKLFRLLYSRFFGHALFCVPFENPKKIYQIFNILAVLNIFLTLLPIIAVDLYGLLKYKWGNQFYIMMIETCILAISMIILQVLEFRRQRQANPNGEDKMYAQLKEMNASIDKESYSKIEEQLKKEGRSMDEFISELRKQRGIPSDSFDKADSSMLKNDSSLGLIGKRNDTGDGRKLHTEAYSVGDHLMNAYDSEKQFSKGKTYDLNKLKNGSEIGNPSKSKRDEFMKDKEGYGLLDSGSFDTKQSGKLNKKQKGTYKGSSRGRSDLEYDSEAKNNGIINNNADTDDELYSRRQEIKENDELINRPGFNQTQNLDDKMFNEDSQRNLSKTSSQLENAGLFEVEQAYGEGSALKQNEIQNFGKDQQQKKKLTNLIYDDDDSHQETEENFEDENPNFATLDPEVDMRNIDRRENNQTVVMDSDDDEPQRIQNMRNPNKKRFNVNDIYGDLDFDEKGNPLVLKDNSGSLIDKQGNKVNQKGYLIDDKTGDVVEKEQRQKIFKKHELDEKGELPFPFCFEKFNFNPHDVRGYLDRDSEGEEIIGIKKDKDGHNVDKLGRRINREGYLVDKDGNLVDKRGRIKLQKVLLERFGGKIPELFTYKARRFDVREIMGDFDKDRNGNIIIRRDKNNEMIDKKGRKVNGKGYLIDQDGNIITQEGRVVFEPHQLSQDYEIPKLFPFLKFDVQNIKGDFELDPLGNPILNKNQQGHFIDKQGRLVNNKGYLIDNRGNILDKKGSKIFSSLDIDEDGEIPKVFRAGVLRKDTQDSFFNLMQDIEELERIQETFDTKKLQELHTKMQQDMRFSSEEESDKIEEIKEEQEEQDDEDESQQELRRQIEQLADEMSEGGNTSVDSKMEDTPSNYYALNLRFNQQQALKAANAKEYARTLRVPQDNNIGEDELLSEYSYAPDGKMRKKKKKKKNKGKKKLRDDKDLLMEKAYGNLTEAQYQTLLKEKYKKEQIEKGTTGGTIGKPPLKAKNMTERAGVQSKPRYPTNKNPDNFTKDFKKFTEDALVSLPQSLNSSTVMRQNNQRSPNRNQTNKTVAQSYAMEGIGQNKNNNFMGSSRGSFNPQGNTINQDDRRSERSSIFQQIGKKITEKGPLGGNQNDAKLYNIANSVSGFYKDPFQSDQVSNYSRAQESSYAQNYQKFKNPNKIAGPPKTQRDDELEKIYQTALGNIENVSNWDRESVGSRQSSISKKQAQINTLKIKGLEGIYLQRIDPNANKSIKIKKPIQSQRFRTNDYEKDEFTNDRDDLESVLSDNYRRMQEQFNNEMSNSNKYSKIDIRKQKQSPKTRTNIKY